MLVSTAGALMVSVGPTIALSQNKPSTLWIVVVRQQGWCAVYAGETCWQPSQSGNTATLLPSIYPNTLQNMVLLPIFLELINGNGVMTTLCDFRVSLGQTKSSDGDV